MTLYSISIIIFAFTFLVWLLERKLPHGTKTYVTCGAAGLIWVLIAREKGSAVAMNMAWHHIFEAIKIELFLIVAMAIVGAIVSFKLFEAMEQAIVRLGLKDKNEIAIAAGVFGGISAVCDNANSVNLGVEWLKDILSGKNLRKGAGAVINAANTLGACTLTGDLTTAMIVLAGLIGAVEVTKFTAIPCIAATGVMILIIIKGPKHDTKDVVREIPKRHISERILSFAWLGIFGVPIVAEHFFHAQPSIALAIAFVVMYIVSKIVGKIFPGELHKKFRLSSLSPYIERHMIAFLFGLLMLVGALYELNVLRDMVLWLQAQCNMAVTAVTGTPNEFLAWVLLIYILGKISAFIDNVALTAIMIIVLGPLGLEPVLWALAAVAVGIGGNYFILGSLAGIMGMDKLAKRKDDEERLHAIRHMKENFWPAFACYHTAFFGVLGWHWIMQKLNWL